MKTCIAGHEVHSCSKGATRKCLWQSGGVLRGLSQAFCSDLFRHRCQMLSVVSCGSCSLFDLVISDFARFCFGRSASQKKRRCLKSFRPLFFGSCEQHVWPPLVVVRWQRHKQKIRQGANFWLDLHMFIEHISKHWTSLT